MKVEQVASILNAVASEVMGDSAITTEHLENIVDMGKAIFNATSYENFARTLVDHIGKVVFVNDPYEGDAPSVMMDGWEYGAVMEKIRAEMPIAVDNASWELTDGTSYDPNIFHKPTVTAKFFSRRVTFEVDISITERQVKSAFSNANQMVSFISMLYTQVDNAFTVRLSSLIRMTINQFTAQTLISEYPSANYSSKSGVRAINLLKLYNEQYHEDGANLLTVNEAIADPDFLRFAAFKMGNMEVRLRSMTSLYNIEGKKRFTKPSQMHTILHSEFQKAAGVYLYGDTFNKEFVSLPKAEGIGYWQGIGTNYEFANTSKIHVNVKDLSDSAGVATEEVVASGILGVMFDRNALGVCNMNRRTTSNYNAKGEFTNFFHKMDAGYFNDLAEQFIVFFIA